MHWLLLYVALGLHAEDKKGPAPVSLQPKAARAADASPGNYEVYRNIIINGGKSLDLDSAIDFSTADSVSVSVRCTTCTSSSNSLTGLLLQAFWSVPEAEQFSVAETRTGGNFPYWDSGGAVFHVYGSQFRLTLFNTGSERMLIQQLVIYRRAP